MIDTRLVARDVRRRSYRSAALGLLAVAAIDVLDPVHTHVPLCPFRAFTGLWCPLCGSLRAVYSLLHGQFQQAARDNVLLVAAIPIALVWWLDGLNRTRSGRPARRWTPIATWAIALLALSFTIVRNLPGVEALQPR